MTLREFRSLLERPFRNYANFSGRAGGAEFWLFLLSLFIATNLAWTIGYGGMRLAGYQSHYHQNGSHHHIHSLEDDTGTIGSGLSHMHHEGHESPLIFKFHRHSLEEGYHLHGSVDGEHFLDEHQRRDGGRDHAGKNADEGTPRTRRHFTFEHDGRTSAEDGADTLQGLVMLALVIPLFAVGARRLHDTNKSGWWQLFALIPLAGWIALAIFFLLPSEQDSNRFGPPEVF